jgi:hypothetical protein
MDRTNDGNNLYHYRVFYVNNIKQTIHICFASYEVKGKLLSLKCGALVSANWKLAASSEVSTQMVGKFDYPEDESNLPAGLWQIDQRTGDWQFCFLADFVGEDNCAYSKSP